MYRLGLGIICKNEKHNLPTLLESLKDCVDAVYVTDTGSTDGTRELLDEWSKGHNPAGCPIHVSDFPWVDDFAAARNFNYEQLKAACEYYMWLDADDSLVNPEAFREWRDRLMPLADQWYATYNYGDAGDGRNRCMFLRERVFRNSFGFEWRYPIHEGVCIKEDGKPPFALYASAWHVLHRRSQADATADKSRNLLIFEKLKASGKPFDARMTFYYGKELFENGKALDAFPVLMDAASHKDTQLHDRILSLQYACLAAAECLQPERAISIAHQGLQLDPTRAEFHIIIGDSLLRMNKMVQAIPFYAAAKHCDAPSADANQQHGAIFTHRDAYTFYPRLQLAKCFSQLGRFDEARVEIECARLIGQHAELDPLLAEVLRMQRALLAASVTEPKGHKPVDEIVITCLPVGFYEWDESSLESRGIGGSESAVVYLAREFGKLGKRVRVFGNVPKPVEFGPVSYHPAAESADYLSKHLPTAHIAWRHTTRLSPAPSFVWCHDLSVPGVDKTENYDKVLALSQFHADWLRLMCNVPGEKIRVVSNAIDKDLWTQARENADFGHERKNTVVWSSSPDRGLSTAIEVMDEVVKQVPDAELHVFYGFENMRIAGVGAKADAMLAECQKRPYIKVRGNLTKRALADAFLQAKAWLYPTDFLETYCITALEAQAAGLHIVARAHGALTERLAHIPETMITGSPARPDVFEKYVAATVKALQTPNSLPSLDILPSWGDVAAEWLTWVGEKK